MGEPVKDGNVWRHRVMVNGQRYSGTFPTKRHALAWEASKRTDTDSEPVAVHTCGEAFRKYEKEVSPKKDGMRWEILRLQAFQKLPIAKVKMSDLNTSHVARWRDDRLATVFGFKKDGTPKIISGSTVKRELNLMTHVFSLARKEWKWLEDSPTKDLERPKENPARTRLIKPSEIDLICAALGWTQGSVGVVPRTKQQYIACIFLWAIETAMRAGEICRLTKDDVVGRVAHISKSKNGYERDVPLSPRALEIWAVCPDGFPVTPKSLDAMFRSARERSSVTGVTFHDTRHLAVTRLARKLDILELARMTGHRDINELQTYYNASPDETAGRL